jgi:hypothetical protein
MQSSVPGALWRRYKNAIYFTRVVVDTVEGFCAVDLHVIPDHQDPPPFPRDATFEAPHELPERKRAVASAVYWDGEGQVFVEMRVKELPAWIVEDLLAEAKRANSPRDV